MNRYQNSEAHRFGGGGLFGWALREIWKEGQVRMSWQRRSIASRFRTLKEWSLASRSIFLSLSPPDPIHHPCPARGSHFQRQLPHVQLLTPSETLLINADRKSIQPMGTNFFFHHLWLLNVKLKSAASNCSWWQLPGFSSCQGTWPVCCLPSVPSPPIRGLSKLCNLAFSQK